MRNLNTIESSQISGGLISENQDWNWSSVKKGAAVGALMGLAIVGTQKIIIDTFNMIPVNSYSVFIGENFGSAEHLSHLKSFILAEVAVLGLGSIAFLAR